MRSRSLADGTAAETVSTQKQRSRLAIRRGESRPLRFELRIGRNSTKNKMKALGKEAKVYRGDKRRNEGGRNEVR